MRINKFTILLRSSELGKKTAWKNKEYNNFVLCQSGILLHVLLNVICLNQNQNPLIHNKEVMQHSQKMKNQSNKMVNIENENHIN